MPGTELNSLEVSGLGEDVKIICGEEQEAGAQQD